MATLKNAIIDDSGYLKLPAGTVDQRPASLVAGMQRYNTDYGNIEYYNGSRWIDPTTNLESGVISNGLIVFLDAGNLSSYPGSGTVWYDLSGKNNNFSILASAYNSSGPKYMDFNGTYGCAKMPNTDVVLSGNVTCICWTRVKNSTAEWRTLLRALSTGGDHQVIIQSGGWLIGMYDNTAGTGFNSSGFSQQSLPNYGTSNWVMLTWRFRTASPYYDISYNDTPNVVRGQNTSANSSFKGGVCSIGAYNNANQNDPSTASQYWGDISQIMLYNRVLSDAEILQTFNVFRNRHGV